MFCSCVVSSPHCCHFEFQIEPVIHHVARNIKMRNIWAPGRVPLKAIIVLLVQQNYEITLMKICLAGAMTTDVEDAQAIH